MFAIRLQVRHVNFTWPHLLPCPQQGKVVIPRVLPAVGGPRSGPGRPEGPQKSTEGV